MLVLAIDTATPAVTTGVVTVTGDGVEVRSSRVEINTRKHAELLMPLVLQACSDAGAALRDMDAFVVGAGPGPFTGLRVGMVTAAALGDALGRPVHGVCTLDAIAADCPTGEPLLVVTDARRREVYWAAYDEAGRRVDGPHVEAPASLTRRAGGYVAAGGMAAVLGRPVVGPESPSPGGLVAVAAEALRAGITPGPLEPLYLRRPDAVEPTGRKRVTAG